MNNYCIYLRKSRADKDAEMRGEGETLARHEDILLKLAEKMKIEIKKIYKEIVSGETIAARPEIQKLIAEVESGVWDGVLVVEVERLARGNTTDQGVIADAFKFGNCKIVTPVKTYDPNNEFDEEYFEFGLFMSRREYKTINRRIQRGRIASVNEGRYIASAAPFGYERVKIKNDKGYTLSIIKDESEVVKLIYNLYTVGELQEDGSFRRLGMLLMVRKLNALGYKTRSGNPWTRSTVKDILTNATYIGKVVWSKRPYKKEMCDGELKEVRHRNRTPLVADGLHEAILTEKQFLLAQKILKSRENKTIPPNKILKNPLSGLVYCGKCGRLMTRTFSTTRKGYFCLSCPNAECDNVRSAIYIIEEAVLKGLAGWLDAYELKWSTPDCPEPAPIFNKVLLVQAQGELSKLEKQRNNAYDLLEQGVYTVDIFQERIKLIGESIVLCKSELAKIEKEYELELKRIEAKEHFVPAIKNILEVYDSVQDAATKNNMLKEVIERIDYVKNERGKRNAIKDAKFDINIIPKVQYL